MTVVTQDLELEAIQYNQYKSRDLELFLENRNLSYVNLPYRNYIINKQELNLKDWIVVINNKAVIFSDELFNELFQVR